MKGDFERYLAGASIESIVADRSARGRRLAKRFTDLPKGLTFGQFIDHPEIADLDLDFVTACEMYEGYKRS